MSHHLFGNDRPRQRRGGAGLRLAAACLAVLALPALTGCTGVAVGAGAGAAVASQEERGLGGTVSDAKIRAEINYLWLDKNSSAYTSLGLLVWDGRVLVSGIVDTEQERAEAIRIAHGVEGVKEVINEVRVDPERGNSFLRDSWITTQLRFKIMSDRDINGINYAIDTTLGTIYLLGTAQDRAELDRVIDYARNIEYVAKVVNHVQLKDMPSGTDSPPGGAGAPPAGGS